MDSLLTPLLTQDADLSSSNTDFQISGFVPGVTGTVTRYGSKYSVELTLNGKKVKKIFAGIGSIVAMRELLTKSDLTELSYNTIATFSLTESFPCEFQDVTHESFTEVRFEFELAFPCEGYTSESGAGYVLAPAVKIDTGLSESVIVMILEAASASNYHVQVPESTMSTSHGDSLAILSTTGGDAIEGSLQVTGKGYDFVRVIFYRTPQVSFEISDLENPETRTDVLSQMLVEAKAAGESTFRWVPARPKWNPTIWLFALPSPTFRSEAVSAYLGTLAKTLGGTGEGYYPNFVFGEGRVTGHLLQLVMRPHSKFSGDNSRLTLVKLE